MPSLVYKVLLEVYSRVSLAAEHRLHPAELAEQIREGYALRPPPRETRRAHALPTGVGARI